MEPFQTLEHSMNSRREREGKRATLTAAIFTYESEGALLRQVFESVRWADEMIVVDMESKDGTRRLCSDYTKKIYVHNERENINANFNFGYQMASCDYVLHISHDFVVSPELHNEILQVLADPNRADVYEIGTLNYFFGKVVQLSVWEKKRLPLLFRKGSVVYPEERLEIWPRVLGARKGVLKHKIHHYTVEHISDLVRKYNRYSDIEIRNNPAVIPLIQNPLLLGLVGIGCSLYNYLFRGGFRFGMHGLIVSFMQGFYFFLQRAKRWERDWVERQGKSWNQEPEK